MGIEVAEHFIAYISITLEQVKRHLQLLKNSNYRNSHNPLLNCSGFDVYKEEVGRVQEGG
jgi:hypothetical protein